MHNATRTGLALFTLALTLTACGSGGPATLTVAQTIQLPNPIVSEQSVETCLNTRESIGSVGPSGKLDTQQLSNVIWAAGRAPMAGTSRTILVATRDGMFGPGTGGTYSYHPDTHSLTKVSNALAKQGDFNVSWDTGKAGLVFDAGLIYMPSLLTAVSSWGGESQVSECPKMWDIVFWGGENLQQNSTCVAHSSVPEGQTGWLPDPSVTGSDRLADVLANLKYVSSFGQNNLTTSQKSQLLWAGYGCTPHKGTKGITTPSAYDSLYLTGTIYLADENGVFRYQNRQSTDGFFSHPGNASGFFDTRDHRLERIRSTDSRASLRSAVKGLPEAPCYIVLALDANRLGSGNDRKFANLETGFVAFNYLLQASAIGLGCNFKTPLTSAEQATVQTVTGIPAGHTPLVIVSLGAIAQ